MRESLPEHIRDIGHGKHRQTDINHTILLFLEYSCGDIISRSFLYQVKNDVCVEKYSRSHLDRM